MFFFQAAWVLITAICMKFSLISPAVVLDGTYQWLPLHRRQAYLHIQLMHLVKLC